MRVEVFDGGLDVDESRIRESRDEIGRQIREYERGERRTFDLTVEFPETFGGRVMAEMDAIPYGETTTYGAIAEALDTAPIAVGGACGRNPVPLVVPCHRVLASDGSLRGYSAPGGLELKRRLLDHERRVADGADRGEASPEAPATGTR